MESARHTNEPLVPPGALCPPEPPPIPPAETTTSQSVTVSTGPSTQSWVSSQLRNFVVIALTVTVIYLAVWVGNASAIAGLIAAWTWSAGGMFQERAALKQPGKDS